MGQKEIIVNLLKTNGTMTQGTLAEAIYGDRNHSPAIYTALMALVKFGVVNREGSNPAYYSLPRYFDDVTKSQIQKWQDSFDYQSYNDYITNKLDEYGITVEHRKRKFDHFVWYKNR